MQIYKFIKRGRDWYIDLPEYIAQGGSEGDLQMVDGADTMLDIISGEESSVMLNISEESFDEADELTLLEKCDPYIGGGNYIMKKYKGETINQHIWLCQVTQFVFGNIPEKIFVSRVMPSF